MENSKYLLLYVNESFINVADVLRFSKYFVHRYGGQPAGIKLPNQKDETLI